MPMTKRAQERLIESAAAKLTDYLASNRTRTDLLKDIAQDIVALRERHHLEDGSVDWSGRSPGYRAAISDVYTRAHVPAELLDTVQAALRYHVGNLIRERAGEGELERSGLSATSPRERLAAHREVINAVARAIDGPRGDVARLATYAEALLEAADVSESALADAGAERLGAAEISLRNVIAHAERLLEVLEETP